MKKTDFNTPQRQSVKGILIMFADNLQGFVRALWLPILLVFSRAESNKLFFLGLMFAVICILFVVIAYIKYRNFTFFLDEHNREFVIQKGVITKRKVVVKLERIQQVNINQSFIQKIAGVYSVDIDTAGSSKKEVSIRAVDHDLAQLLKEKLLAGEKQNVRDEETETYVETILEINPLTLLKVGLTSNYGRSIALIFGFFFYIIETFKDLSESALVTQDQVSGLIGEDFEKLSISILILVVLFVLLAINVGRTYIKFFDFKIQNNQGAILLNFGLFAKKNTLLKPSKVQVTIFSRNFIQKKLELFNLKIKQASSTEFNDKESGKSDIEIPGCSENERNKLFRMIYGNKELPEKEFKPDYRYLIKASFIAFLIMIPFGVFLYFSDAFSTQAIFIIIPIVAALMALIIFLRFKNYRLYISPDFIMFKSNVWDIEYKLVEPYKIQGITVKQYLWHKAADVAHLRLHTAAGDLGFDFIKYHEIKPYIDLWLYEAEKSNRKWM